MNVFTMAKINQSLFLQNFSTPSSALFCYFGVGVYLGDDTCTALPTGPAYKRELRPKRFFLLNSISIGLKTLENSSFQMTPFVEIYLLMSLDNRLFLNRKELSLLEMSVQPKNLNLLITVFYGKESLRIYLERHI